MQLEIAMHCRYLRHLGQKRRDANSTRDQQMLSGAQVQREQVDRVTDQHVLARCDPVVQIQRPAAPGIIAPDGNFIAGQVSRIAHQRIGVAPLDRAILHIDNGMRPAGKGRHLATIAAHEPELFDQGIDLHHPGHRHGNFFSPAHANRSTAGGTMPGVSASIFTP